MSLLGVELIKSITIFLFCIREADWCKKDLCCFLPTDPGILYVLEVVGIEASKYICLHLEGELLEYVKHVRLLQRLCQFCCGEEELIGKRGLCVNI